MMVGETLSHYRLIEKIGEGGRVCVESHGYPSRPRRGVLVQRVLGATALRIWPFLLKHLSYSPAPFILKQPAPRPERQLHGRAQASSHRRAEERGVAPLSAPAGRCPERSECVCRVTSRAFPER